ncbi:very short patch repair endonuclease [Bordetella bronchialis]|uniref:very short patch repair endonuclease n=1 Tax=Bordetella bronchialis TaxID=463025 RepID=UPI003D010CFB
MRAIGPKDSAPEMLVRRAAHRLGLRFRLHVRSLPGTPDLVLARRRAVIFVHGCFWHRHQGCKKATTPKSNVQFWTKKFEGNTQRDTLNYQLLAQQGWRVIVLWQCQFRSVEDAMEILQVYFHADSD